MGFESGLKIPKSGCTSREGSVNEVFSLKGGTVEEDRRVEAGVVGAKEVSRVGGGEATEGFVGAEEYFEMNAFFD